MIQVNHLDFAYATDGFRLRVDDLEVADGERVAWSGPSGSGKTTLLNLVAGILLPHSGAIVTGGVDVTRLSDAARRDFRIKSIGLVFQEFELLDYLTLLDNVLLAYRINRSLRLTTSVRERAASLLSDVGLDALANRFPDQLSHGQRQRIAVCRALLTAPQLVLADEPTANLDDDNKRRVLDILDAHTRQHATTLVVVTHDREVMDRLDRNVDVAGFAEMEAGPLGGLSHHA